MKFILIFFCLFFSLSRDPKLFTTLLKNISPSARVIKEFFFGKYFEERVHESKQSKSNKTGILRTIFSGVGQFDPSFIFQEKLIQYQYNVMHLLNNVCKVGWKWKMLILSYIWWRRILRKKISSVWLKEF